MSRYQPVILATLSVLFATLYAVAQEAEILSKDDARRMFGMSQEVWLADVQAAVSAGQAIPMGDQGSGIGMAMNMADGSLLIVRPSYGRDSSRPDFIQVIVGYREPLNPLLTESTLEETIRAAQQQMSPEYSVFGTVEDLPGGIGIFFSISETAEPN